MPGRSSNSANPTDNYKFTGHERDEEAGLTIDYMMARTYDPMIGRFLQTDPAMEFASPYTYVGNNPLGFTDPTGMTSEGCCTLADLKEGVRRTINMFRSDVSDKASALKQEISSIDISTIEGQQQAVGMFLPISIAPEGAPTLSEQVEGVQTSFASFMNADLDTKAKIVTGLTVTVFTLAILRKRKGSRKKPGDLREQLTLEEARGGAGNPIMEGRLSDSKYNPKTGKYEKMSHNHDRGDGTSTEVHYDRDRKTGEGSNFKIKDDTNKNSRGNQ